MVNIHSIRVKSLIASSNNLIQDAIKFLKMFTFRNTLKNNTDFQVSIMQVSYTCVIITFDFTPIHTHSYKYRMSLQSVYVCFKQKS